MSSEIASCSCQSSGVTADVAENAVIIENPFQSTSASNFEIIRFKPLKQRLLDNYNYPTFTYKYIEDIKKTLRHSCSFEHIKDVLYYLERNPNIHAIVPELLEFISCELKKEDQQRAPILLRALYCLYTNSVSAVTDFSVCTNALEHFLTKSSTFPGDYVLKDIAADILSDFCAMSPSDELKNHFVLELSRVFHNPNWHSYNLYGGIVGCLSNMSAKSGPEVVPYDEFNNSTFLRHALSSPRMLRKLFYLCKPFIYSSLPSRLIPRPLHNENSFYDLNTKCAGFFNLMRNEMITPISCVKYDHKFSTHYQFEGGWFDDAKWSNLPADCKGKDLIWPGYSAYRREQMLKKNTDSEGNERNSPMDAKAEGSINSNESERNLETGSKSGGSISSSESLQDLHFHSKSNCNINSNKSSQTGCKSDGCLYFTGRKGSLRSGHKSDGCVKDFNKKKHSDFDRSEYTKIWLDKYGGNANRDESEMNPLTDKESEGYSDFNRGASSSRPVRKSDGYVKKSKKIKYSGFDRKSDYTKRWLDKYESNAKCSKSELDPLIDRVSDDCVGNSAEIEISRRLRKQNIQSAFSESDTDGSKSEENVQVKNERKLRSLNRTRHEVSRKQTDAKGLCEQDVQTDFLKGKTRGSNSDKNFQIKNEKELHFTNQRRLQVSLKKIDWKFDDKMDITDHGINPQVDSKDNSDISRCEKDKNLQVISESDINVKTSESEKISLIGNKCGRDSSKSDKSGDGFQNNFKSKSDKDNSENELNFLIKNDGDMENSKTDRNSLTGCKLKDDIKSSERFFSLPLISPGKLGNFQTGDKSKNDLNSNKSEKNLLPKTERNSCIDWKPNDMDTDEVKNLKDGNKSSRDVQHSESESNLQTDCERNDGATDITDCKKNLQGDNKSNEDVKNSEREMDLPFYIVYDSTVDGVTDRKRNLQVNCKPVDPGCSSRVIPRSILEYKQGINFGVDANISDSKRHSQAHRESTGDMNVPCGERNLQGDSKPCWYDWAGHLRDDIKPTEQMKDETNNEMMVVDSQKARKCDDRSETRRPESPGFRSHKEYSDFLAWKRERSYADSHKWNKIGETLQLIPPPEHIDESIFDPPDVHYLVPDTHIISCDYISEESLADGGHCCERANSCASPSVVCSSQPDFDIFKNLDKNMFANWEFKKPKAAKKESPGAEKTETRGQLQKKCKTRGGRKR